MMNDKSKHPSQDELQAYLDQELETHASQYIEEHLKICSSCQVELYQLNNLISRLESLEEFRINVDLSSSILAKIQDEEQVPLGLTWTLLVEGIAAGLVIGLLIPVIRSTVWIPKLIDTQSEVRAAINIFMTQLASNWVVWWAKLQLIISQILEGSKRPISLPDFWPSPWILILIGVGAGLFVNYFLLRNSIHIQNGNHKD
jgi:hypothetical protein